MSRIYEISKFTGFGNSLIAITNAIKLAEFNQGLVRMSKHGTQKLSYEILKNIKDIDFSNKNDIHKWPVEKKKFYFKKDCNGLLPSIPERRKYLLNHVLSNIKLNQIELSDNVLVIHVRSGDIFGYDINDDHRSWIHKDYIQPPFEYYQRIIEYEKPEKIMIVSTPDFANPVISKILQIHKNVKLVSNNIHKDVSLLTSAKKLVTGFGSFAAMSALMSRSITKLYIQQPFHDLVYLEDMPSNFKDLDFEVVQSHFPNYITRGTWKNTSEQKERMINYTGVKFDVKEI
jgi:hypothetical protein